MHIICVIMCIWPEKKSGCAKQMFVNPMIKSPSTDTEAQSPQPLLSYCLLHISQST